MMTPEDLQFTPPRFEKKTLSQFAKDQFGVIGELRPLEGERDQNHRLITPDGTNYVLKISGCDEEPAIVDFQVKALQHIEKHTPELNVPRCALALNGEPIATISDQKGQSHQARLLTYLPGVPLWDEAMPSLKVIKEIGGFQGKLCKALENFDHPEKDHFMAWNISNGLTLDPSLATSKFGDVERLVVPLLDRFKNKTLPAINALRHQVIHNDAHRGNLLKSASGVDDIVGVIDFGDLINAPVINDLSVSMDSFLSAGKHDPIEIGAALISGFHEQFPLTDEEINLLYDVCILRGALTIQLVDFQLRHPESATDGLLEEYPSMVRAFESNLSIDPAQATARWHQACHDISST